MLCSVFSNVCSGALETRHHNTNLSTGPPRPPMPAGRVSWLLLVSGSRERVNKNKGDSDDVSKSRGSVLLSTAAKLRVVVERDLGKRDTETHAMLWREKEEYTQFKFLFNRLNMG